MFRASWSSETGIATRLPAPERTDASMITEPDDPRPATAFEWNRYSRTIGGLFGFPGGTARQAVWLSLPL
jgi:hypothetical protein